MLFFASLSLIHERFQNTMQISHCHAARQRERKSVTRCVFGQLNISIFNFSAAPTKLCRDAVGGWLAVCDR